MPNEARGEPQRRPRREWPLQLVRVLPILLLHAVVRPEFEEDLGSHTVCVVLTGEFLEFSQLAGNDLTTPRPEWGFPGLHPGERWCICAERWLEAYRAGCPPPAVLGATHAGALDVIPIEALSAHAFQAETA